MRTRVAMIAAVLFFAVALAQASGKDHSAEYKVGTFMGTQPVSDGSYAHCSGAGCSAYNAAHNIHMVTTEDGAYAIEAPTSLAATIVVGVLSRGNSPTIHKPWFMDDLHEGDQMLFAAKCDMKHPRHYCAFWLPNPDKTGKEFSTRGWFTPAVAKTNTTSLCGMGKLSASVEAQVCRKADDAKAVERPPTAPAAVISVSAAIQAAPPEVPAQQPAVQPAVSQTSIYQERSPGLAISASAQDTGAIRGTVSDSTGRRIVDASIALVDSAQGFTYFVTSDAEGKFVFEFLPPGDYLARAVAPDMSPQITPSLHVNAGGTTQLDFTLQVGGAKEMVTVSGDPPLVETQSNAVSSMVDKRAIEELPLDGRRFTDLALLTPGVTQDPRGLTSGSNGDLAFGGIRGYQSSYLVDGADNNNAFFAQARGRYRAPYQFSEEVVEEFRVSSNTYGADLGRAGGAVINVITKSGSNQLHGTDFYFIRDSEFGATQPDLDFKPHSQQQQFGFTLGGPLHRNHIFFYGGLDQHIFHVPAVVRFLDGSAQVVPQAGQEPLHAGDYEPSDQAIVFAAAAQLSTLAGQFPSTMTGNAGFFKLDFTLTPHESLSTRLSTSRYSGLNNVFLDPSSPLTTNAISENGQENVNTETGSAALTSTLSWRLINHLRAQFSRDLQQSSTNATIPLTVVRSIIDGFGRSNILPRQTREHRLQLADTISLEGKRNSWKLGGDALLTWIYNYFPAQSGGEYIFDQIKVDPFTFEPQEAGLQLTPLRAYAHDVPKYYIQNFGNQSSHPDTNEYSGFLQDTIRATSHLAISIGARYDLQTFTKKGLLTNPLWPDSGKIPYNPNNYAPRVGLAYSLGDEHPLVVRAGYGWFYTRIPQIYTSTVVTDNGYGSANLFLENSNYYDHQIFPQYPNPLVNCPLNATSCTLPSSLAQYAQAGVSSFSPNFKTPKVEQASLGLEREVAHRLPLAFACTSMVSISSAPAT